MRRKGGRDHPSDGRRSQQDWEGRQGQNKPSQGDFEPAQVGTEGESTEQGATLRHCDTATLRHCCDSVARSAEQWPGLRHYPGVQNFVKGREIDVGTEQTHRAKDRDHCANYMPHAVVVPWTLEP